MPSLISMYPQGNERIDQEVIHKSTEPKLTSKNASPLWQSMDLDDWILFMEKMVIMNSEFYIAILTKFEPVWIWNNNKVWEHRIGEREHIFWNWAADGDETKTYLLLVWLVFKERLLCCCYYIPQSSKFRKKCNFKNSPTLACVEWRKKCHRI